MASKNIKTVNEDNFDVEVLNSALPVLVDFWAPWCGPCKSIAPFLDEIADEKVGVFKICKINVDDSPDIAARFGIKSIPTLIFFKGGKLVNQVVGVVPKKHIEGLLSKIA